MTAAVGFVLGTASMVGMPDMPILARICAAAATCLISVLAGLGLSLRDALDERVQRGLHVDFLLRLYFGPGLASIPVWIVTTLAVVFTAAVMVSMAVS